jgi:hypothetical protein
MATHTSLFNTYPRGWGKCTISPTVCLGNSYLITHCTVNHLHLLLTRHAKDPHSQNTSISSILAFARILRTSVTGKIMDAILPVL